MGMTINSADYLPSAFTVPANKPGRFLLINALCVVIDIILSMNEVYRSTISTPKSPKSIFCKILPRFFACTVKAEGSKKKMF